MAVYQLYLLAMVSLQPGAMIGEFTVATGQIEIERQGQRLQAVVGSGIVEGDQISTAESGCAAFLINEGILAYLAPKTRLTIDVTSEPTFRLDQGEVRLTAVRGNGLSVISHDTVVQLSQGVIRVAVGSAGSRVRVERGEAKVAVVGVDPIVLTEGDETLAPSDGMLRTSTTGSSSRWQLQVEDLQMSAAAESSRRQKQGQVSDANDTVVKAYEEGSPNFIGPPRPPGMPGPVRDASENLDNPLLSPPAERGGALPPPPTERTGANDRLSTSAATSENQAYQPVAVGQPVSLMGGGGTFALALGAVSGSSAGGLSGGASSDAQQGSFNMAFPGDINLVTAQSAYTLSSVHLRPSDHFAQASQYWSVGLGNPATTQVATDFRTGSSVVPRTLLIPGFHAYLLNLSQYGIPDLANANSQSTNALGISGLLGAVPVAPRISGATPLTDSTAVFNNRATFALGQFALSSSGNNPVFALRRSDQDRQIIKSPTGNDNLDIIQPNPQVTFTKVVDNKFFPQLPYIEVPSESPIKNVPTYGKLDLLQKAAFTTLVADSLYKYSLRTGQTRFVVDHRIVDITGYRPAKRPDPLMIHASGVSPAANVAAGTRRAHSRASSHH